MAVLCVLVGLLSAIEHRRDAPQGPTASRYRFASTRAIVVSLPPCMKVN
jgi:hypothetical protein